MNEREVFIAALQKESDAERQAYLDEACGGDPALRRDVEALLAVYERAGSFLEHPLGDPAVTTDDPIRERPGTIVGPYKLLEQIGEGGMGLVFVAEQQQPIKRRVALKIIKPGMDSRQVIARFEAERQALALMDHPNIAKVHDGGTTRDGRPYFVMELVKGTPITEHCDVHRLDTHQRLQLFLDVCHAVQHAHQKGIIHRDLKPSNLLVEIHDVRAVVKVIDFGIAKATGQQLTEKTLYTGVAQMIGTPLYMSPEQAGLSSLDVDTRSDVYSLGVLLYELLTGTTPFDGETLRKADYDEIRRIIREDEPPRPSARLSTLQQARLSTIAERRGLEPRRLSQQLRGELDWIVMNALEKDRNRRYESASAFAADVQRYLADEPVVACPPSAGYRLRKFSRRHKGGLAAAVLVLFFLVLVGSGVGWVVRDRSAREAEAIRQQGERQAKAAGAVESIFGEVDRLEKEQKWPEALEAARRAEAAAAGGDAEAATTERVQQRLRELAFLDRLERIRMEKYTLIEGRINFAEVDRNYARAFREYGVDVDELPVETVIDRLRTRPALTIALAAALDDWVNERRLASPADVIRWKRLVTVARGIDPEPLRDRVRASWGQPIAKVRDDLRRLAESIDVKAQHPATLFILVRTLKVAALPESAMRIVRAAQNLHPQDFSLNILLGNDRSRLNDHEGAVRFFTAAVAIRPHSAVAHNLLAQALIDQKKLDEAIAACRKAIELELKYAPAHGTLGVALHRKGLFDEAIAEHHKALELSAQNADAGARATAQNNIGNSLAAKGRGDEAILAYKKAIEFDPKYVPAHTSLGVSLRKKGRVDEAIAEYKKAIELDPKNATLHTSLGNALLENKGRVDEAILEYKKVIELDPKDAAAHTSLGVGLQKKSRVDEAIAEHRKAIELDPKLTLGYLNLGVALQRKSLHDEAIAAYRKALELDPKLAVAHYNLGTALHRKGRVDEAIAAYRKALELDPKKADAHYNFGIALHRKGRVDEAIAEYRKAIELDPKYLPVHYYIALALRNQGKLDEAVAEFRKAVKLDPKSAPAHYELGLLLRNRGKLDEAVAEFRKAIELNPKHSEAHNGLGIALYRQKKLDEAVAEYRKAIELDPKNAAAHDNLGNALGKQRKLDEAVAEHRKAIELDPKNALPHGNLGVALGKQRKLDEAAAEFRKAIELDPKNALPHGNLGNTLCAQGKLDEAAAEYRKAIELNPKSEPARSGLGNILARKGWDLANHPNPKLRDLKRAVELGKESVALTPQSSEAWQHLGWILYRAGNWKASIEALENSCRLQAGGTGDCGQWIVMSLAHAKLAAQEGLTEKQREHHKTEARHRYEQANKQIDGWGRVRPSEAMAQTIWDFRAEARGLVGSRESKK